MVLTKIDYPPINGDYKDGHRQGFINVYKEVFSGPPYFESYQDHEVLALVWEPHFTKGHVLLALADEQVIGLSCCLPLGKMDSQDPNVGALDSLRSFPGLPFDWRQACYMSELAVLSDWRRKGIGTELIKRRLAWAKTQGLKYYVMRTASEGSNSLGLYSKLGAQRIPDLEQDVSHEGVDSASKKRIFLFGAIG